MAEPLAGAEPRSPVGGRHIPEWHSPEFASHLRGACFTLCKGSAGSDFSFLCSSGRFLTQTPRVLISQRCSQPWGPGPAGARAQRFDGPPTAYICGTTREPGSKLTTQSHRKLVIGIRQFLNAAQRANLGHHVECSHQCRTLVCTTRRYANSPARDDGGCGSPSRAGLLVYPVVLALTAWSPFRYPKGC